MLREESDCIRVCQIFCHKADTITNAWNDELFTHFDYIDINCGCPAPKIVKNNEGSAMMRDIDNSRAVITALATTSNKPISVKFRLGIDGVDNYIEFGKMCEESGASFITLHARTREQGYAGVVDKAAYEKLINAVNIPVFWSGDILTAADVEYARSIGCAGVMIGRGAMGRPEIFSELKHITPPYSKKEAIIKHLQLLKTYFKTEKTLVAYFKKHLMWYVKSTDCATKTKLKILEFTKLNQLEELIESL